MRSSLFLHYILSDGILQAVLEIHADLSECTELLPERARCYAIITMESLYGGRYSDVNYIDCFVQSGYSACGEGR